MMQPDVSRNRQLNSGDLAALVTALQAAAIERREVTP